MTAPATHHDVFSGLARGGVDFLVAGATALTLHGVPRLTWDLDLILAPGPENLARARGMLARWGYARRADAVPGHPAGTAVERFAHPEAALAEIDLVRVAPEEYAALAGRATTFTLVDTPVPTVGRADLARALEAGRRPEDREDLAGLAILEAILRGEQGPPGDPRWVQARRFQRWHTENRCEWLLAANRVRAGLPPDVPPPRDARFRARNPWKR